MQTLATFVRIEIEVFLVALLMIVAFQLITGKINMKGLLLEKKADGSLDGFSPARLQMLLVTLAGAFYLISQVIDSIHHPGSPQFPLQFPGNDPQFRFPAVDSRLFLLLGGSHSVYLGGKLNSFFNLFRKSDTTDQLN